jgi:ribonuclease HI
MNITNATDEKKINDEYVLYFDGCSKGNPGVAGAGFVIYNNQVEIYHESLFVGEKETNNVAEYSGLVAGLTAALIQNIKNLQVRGDSELIIKQMKGLYKVNSANIIKLYQQAKAMEKMFTTITFKHVYRTDNKRADALANAGILL